MVVLIIVLSGFDVSDNVVVLGPPQLEINRRANLTLSDVASSRRW
jgi:hypothetical protein